jgi:hypothetical protein
VVPPKKFTVAVRNLKCQTANSVPATELADNVDLWDRFFFEMTVGRIDRPGPGIVFLPLLLPFLRLLIFVPVGFHDLQQTRYWKNIHTGRPHFLYRPEVCIPLGAGCMISTWLSSAREIPVPTELSSAVWAV